MNLSLPIVLGQSDAWIPAKYNGYVNFRLVVIILVILLFFGGQLRKIDFIINWGEKLDLEARKNFSLTWLGAWARLKHKMIVWGSRLVLFFSNYFLGMVRCLSIFCIVEMLFIWFIPRIWAAFRGNWAIGGEYHYGTGMVVLTAVGFLWILEVGCFKGFILNSASRPIAYITADGKKWFGNAIIRVFMLFSVVALKLLSYKFLTFFEISSSIWPLDAEYEMGGSAGLYFILYLYFVYRILVYGNIWD